MKQVAKLAMINPDGKYLLMYRSDHPVFGTDPDLPGGIVEDGETLVEAVIREVWEESGIVVSPDDTRQVYADIDYSNHGTVYALFVTQLKSHPEIKISWEHSSYEWLDYDSFLDKAKNANDTYMHMVYDMLR